MLQKYHLYENHTAIRVVIIAKIVANKKNTPICNIFHRYCIIFHCFFVLLMFHRRYCRSTKQNKKKCFLFCFVLAYSYLCNVKKWFSIIVLLVFAVTAKTQNKLPMSKYQTIDMRDGLAESRVRQIKQMSDGRIVIATTATIDIFDGTHFESFALPPQMAYPLPSYLGGHQIDCDSTGIIWLRNNRTLYVLDTRKKTLVGNIDSLLKLRGITADSVSRWPKNVVEKQFGEINDVKTVLHDSYGGLWIGTREKGILYSNPARQRQFVTTTDSYDQERTRKFCTSRASQLSARFAPDATNCTLDSRQSDYTYIGTRQGVMVCDRNDSLIAVFNSHYGMSNDNVQGLIDDGKGSVWAATANGITRLMPIGKDSFSITNYGRLDGILLDGREFHECEMHQDPATGFISVGFAGGTVIFHPDSVKAPRYTFTYPNGSETTARSADHAHDEGTTWWLFAAVTAAILLAATALFIIKKRKNTANNLGAKARRLSSKVEKLSSIDDTFARIVSDADAQTDDERFLSKLKHTVEENIGNEDFSVQQLGELMAMDRTVLYRRMLSLTQMTPSNYIRSVRLSVAARLLKETAIPIPEIAMQTGFSTVKYFNRVFKEEFGASPSDFRKTKTDENPNI